MSLEHLGQFNVVGNMQFTKGILLLDDCEGTYNWSNAGTGADYVGEYATAAAFFGLKGLSMKTRATDPAEDDTITVRRYVPWPESRLLVWRARVCFPDQSLVKSFALDVILGNGVDNLWASMLWDPNTPEVQYKDSGGDQQAVAGLEVEPTDNQWAIIEMVIDLEADEYVSFLVGGVRKSLAGIALRDWGNTTTRYLYLDVKMVAAGAAQASAYVDSLYCGEYENL